MKLRLLNVFFFSSISFMLLGFNQPNTVVATINVGATPAGMAITPDNKYLYVANNNNYRRAGDTYLKQDSVTVIDLETNFVVKTIYDTSFSEPYTVTINPAGTIAYVTNSGGAGGTTITKISTATNTVIGTITGFYGPTGMAINSSGTVGYVNNYNDATMETSGLGTTVSVVDLTTDAITATIALSSLPLPVVVGATYYAAPAAIAITPDNKYVYVANYNTYVDAGDQFAGQGYVDVISTATNTVVDTITSADLLGLFDVIITPDGKYAYVSNFGSNNFYPYGTTVTQITTATKVISNTITLGIQPAGLALTPDGRYLYMSNYNTLYNDPAFNALVPGQGTVNIFDRKANKLLPITIPVGQSPANIVISPNGQYAYVSNYSSNVVNVIALQSFQVTAAGCKTSNRYLNQVDYINTITWTVAGTSLPVMYFIYRDADLLQLAGTVSSSEPSVFLDHNRNPNINETYYIVGVNSVGTLSEPVVITVSKSC